MEKMPDKERQRRLKANIDLQKKLNEDYEALRKHMRQIGRAIERDEMLETGERLALSTGLADTNKWKHMSEAEKLKLIEQALSGQEERGWKDNGNGTFKPITPSEYLMKIALLKDAK